jgi:predicted Zn-dependent peptidase
VIALSTLPNGVRVVTEALPLSRSVTTGFWVGVGARDEAPAVAGASHFLEHLLFKGTESRTAAQIAEAVDAVGGEMNAFTAQEYTAYYTRLPAGQLVLGLDILCDVLWAPAFRPHEIEAERQVILEEIAMEEDTPDDRVITLLGEALFPGHPLGREVLGSRASIAAMDRDDIRGFHDTWYRPANLVVAVAGAITHDEVVDGVTRRLAGIEGGRAPERHAPFEPPRAVEVLRHRGEQVHLAVGMRALPKGDDDRFALEIANVVLGGGMSSRLFQTIREERGLAYSVYSYPVSYTDCGALVVYAGTAPARLAEVHGLVMSELDRLLEDGITESELRVAKGYIEGSTVLGLEDSGGCMSRIGKAVLVHGRVLEVDEVLARFRAVTLADVRRAVARVLEPGDRSVAVVGPTAKRDVLRSLSNPGSTAPEIRQRSGT